jgi:hypothetical protein
MEQKIINELQKLNYKFYPNNLKKLSFNVLNIDNTILTRTQFIDCYQTIRHLMSILPNYDGGGFDLNENNADFYFSYDSENREGYEYIVSITC